MARFALGSTTSPFTIKPLDFVCLALLIEFQNIQLDLSDQKPADSAAHPALSDEDVRTNYMLMEAILDVVTQTIFGNHDDSRLSRSISGVYGMLRAKAPDIDHLNIHQHIISINHTLNFAFQGTVDGLYEFTNRLYSLIAPPVALNSNPDDTVEFKLESPLGLYIRRCRLYVAKLEFDAVSDLVHHLKLFCVSECNTAVPIAMQGNVTPSLGSHSLRSEPECQPLSPPAMDPVTEAYLEFTEAYAPDYHRSSRALRRFYDTRCSMGATLPGALNSLPNDSNNEYIPGLNHQQALLSLAQFHYRTQGYPAAHDVSFLCFDTPPPHEIYAENF